MSALTAQNDKSVTSGSEDHTLIGDASATHYNDSTGFLTSGKVVTSDYDQPPEENQLLTALHPILEDQHTIKSILTRPIKIATITFLNSMTPGTQMFPAGFDVLNTLRTAPGFRLVREKIAGFYGINMTATLKITLNPQPFESGIFQIYFIPFTNTYDPTVNQLSANTEQILPFTTGCPNVLCNIGIQSEVQLSIPYTGPTPFINMTNQQSDFGRFYVQSIVPIDDSTDSASCELSVYLYFENVELFGASPRTWTLQGDVQPPKNEADVKTHGAPQKNKGPLTSLIGGVQNTANNVVDKLMPLLDSLGLSAPSANPNPVRIHQDPYASFATVDTTKTPLKASYTAAHQLRIAQLGIDSEDELKLVHIAEKPCYYNQFSWSTTQDAGTQLFSYKVEPNCILYSSNTATTQFTHPTRFRYVANCFRYWRGTIRFTFHLAANKFHSGRLRFVYSLGGNLDPTRTQELYPYSFSQIVDLRDSTTYVVDVPYFASTPYRLIPQIWTGETYDVAVDAPTGSLIEPPGTLQVFIENELRASETTTNNVQIVCMQSCGPDFEFATVIQPKSFPYYQPDPTPAEAQSDCAQIINMVSATHTQKINNISAGCNSAAIGEVITSVRQLIKRPQLVAAGMLTDEAAPNRTDYILFPFAFVHQNDVSSATGDLFAYFRHLYRFYRGSHRFLLTTGDTTAQFMMRYDANGTDLVDYAIPSGTTWGSRSPIASITYQSGSTYTSLPLTATIPFFSTTSGGMEFEIPYYSRFHKLGTNFVRGYDTYYQGITNGKEPPGLVYIKFVNSPINTPVYLYRYAADDYNYGYLLGAPFTLVGQVPQP